MSTVCSFGAVLQWAISELWFRVSLVGGRGDRALKVSCLSTAVFTVSCFVRNSLLECVTSMFS